MPLPKITFQSTGASAQTNVPFTFGQVFAKGDLPAGSALKLVADDASVVPCQVNVKNTHADGSVKHAILSAIVPALAASASIDYSIAIAASAPTGAAPVPSDFAGLTAVATITDTGTDVAGPTAGTIYTADAAAKLAAGQYEKWLEGPICSEWILRVPLVTAGGVEHPDLHARFSIRAYKGLAQAKIDYIIENNWAKPKAPQPTTGTPWETVSVLPRIYAYQLKAGNTVVEERAVNGFLRVRLTYNTGGTYAGNTTGLPNDATAYTAAVTIDGVTKQISVAGSAAQTFGQLYAAITTQLDGLGTCAIDVTNNLGMVIKSASTGATSSVTMDYGSLVPALTNTGLSASTSSPVTYTATITVNGTAKAVSVVGNAATSFARLCTLLNAQLAGLAVCSPQLAAPGIKIVAVATGSTSGITITDGNLFSTITPKVFLPYRPMRGDEVMHYAACRWKKTFWWGTEPATHIRHDKAYLIASHAVPNYAPGLVGDSARIATTLAKMKANEDIGGYGVTNAFMGATGYAPGIGILPEWAAMYIVNQGIDAKYIMLKQADLQGSWRVHAREYDTDKPISFVKWPYATWSPNVGDSRNAATGLNEKLPVVVAPSHLPTSINTPDIAHHPDFGFVPYLVTGDHYYLETLLFYFNFTVLNMNAHASYRDGGKALYKGEGQVRGQGWSFRTLAHARYLIPDDHPLRDGIKYIMEQNVAWYNSRYVDPAGTLRNPFGHFGGLIYSRNGQAGNSNACFQEEFVTQSCGRAVELGFEEFRPLLFYKSEHVKGRMTSGPDFCWYLASNYTLQYRDTATSPMYTTWAEVYNKGFSADITSKACGTPEFAAAIGMKVGSMSGYPTEIGGLVANMQPAVAYCATFDMPRGKDAWLIYESRSETPDYNLGPQFAIVPRDLESTPALPMGELYRSGTNWLGGAISATPSGAAFFDTVTSSEAQASIEYRCEYVRNNDPIQTIKGAVLWLSSNTESPDTVIEAGLGTSPVNGVEQTIASETTAPTGVTFSLADSKAVGIALGDLPPSASRAVWYRRTSSAGTQTDRIDTFTRTVEGTL